MDTEEKVCTLNKRMTFNNFSAFAKVQNNVSRLGRNSNTPINGQFDNFTLVYFKIFQTFQ